MLEIGKQYHLHFSEQKSDIMTSILIKTYLKLCERIPGFRKITARWMYQAMGRFLRQDHWTYMNYGYATINGHDVIPELDKKDEAEVLYKQAISDDEKIGESWWRLALMYSVFDRMHDALNLLKEAESKGIIFDTDGQGVVKEILQRASSTEAISGTMK